MRLFHRLRLSDPSNPSLKLFRPEPNTVNECQLMKMVRYDVIILNRNSYVRVGEWFVGLVEFSVT